MSNCDYTNIHIETCIKLGKEINVELADATLYKQIIDSLKHLCNTKPNIRQSVCLVSMFMEKPRTCHLLATKRILRYIRGKSNKGVLIPNQKNTSKKAMTYGYFDSDWGGDQNDMKSNA